MKKLFALFAVVLGVVVQTPASAQVVASVNMNWDQGSYPAHFIDNYKDSFIRNFASVPNVDPKQVALLTVPGFYKEHNPYKQADVVKASMAKLKSLSYGKDGLVAITVNRAAEFDLTNPATGEYKVDLSFPHDAGEVKGFHFSLTGQPNYDYGFNYAFSFAQAKKNGVMKTLGQARARQIEELIGSQRDQYGHVMLPVTFYVKLKTAKVDEAYEQGIKATIGVEIESADIAFGDANSVKTILHLDKQDIQSPTAAAKDGTVPRGWY